MGTEVEDVGLYDHFMTRLLSYHEAAFESSFLCF